jgi:hypothetical protein
MELEPRAITPGQFKRAVTDFRRYANENVKVAFKGSVFWVLGSEQAINNMMHEYRHVSEEGKIEQGFDEKLGEHYFKLNMKNLTGELYTDQ